jgi:hypothetical protein
LCRSRFSVTITFDMASPLNNINLIRTKTSSSPQLEAIEASLKKTGYLGLAIICSIGIVAGIVYIFLLQQKTYLEATKENLGKEITKNIQKEGMYISIKDRTRIVKLVMANQKPWTQLLDRVATIVSPPALTDITVDDLGKITISIRAGSVDTILNTANALIEQANQNHIINPQLISFQIGKTGSITATITFFVVFQNI